MTELYCAEPPIATVERAARSVVGQQDCLIGMEGSQRHAADKPRNLLQHREQYGISLCLLGRRAQARGSGRSGTNPGLDHGIHRHAVLASWTINRKGLMRAFVGRCSLRNRPRGPVPVQSCPRGAAPRANFIPLLQGLCSACLTTIAMEYGARPYGAQAQSSQVCRSITSAPRPVNKNVLEFLWLDGRGGSGLGPITDKRGHRGTQVWVLGESKPIPHFSAQGDPRCAVQSRAPFVVIRLLDVSLTGKPAHVCPAFAQPRCFDICN